jgi:plastocyanin
MRKGNFRALFALSAALTVSTASLPGATVYWDYDFGFNPSTVYISPGETVYYVNADLYGFSVLVTSEASAPDYFNFFLADFYDSGSHTYNTAGSFGFHSDWGDHGSVIVNAPPSVTITNPVDNAVFTAPATVTVSARATDADGIYDVEFYADDSISGPQLIGDDFTSPYSATTTLAEGTYTLTAVAYDNFGFWNSHSITITVTSAPAIGLGNPRLAGNQFLFDVTGLTVGKTNVVQYCSNLSAGTWIPTATNVATATSRTVTNTAGVGPRFYQVFQRP